MINYITMSVSTMYKYSTESSLDNINTFTADKNL